MVKSKVKSISIFAVIAVLVVLIVSIIRVNFIPNPDPEKTLGHYFFESVVGPLGAVLALFSTILTWMAARSLGGVIGRGLTIYAIGIIPILVGMVAFGIHGYTPEILAGDITRYILRTSILIATGLFFAGSAVIATETLRS